MGYIYWIETSNGVYIGKYHNKEYMWYHLLRAAPFNNTKLQDAWEADWKQNLYNFGYQQSNYIVQTDIYDESIITKNLIYSFDKIVKNTEYNIENGKELYDLVAAMWGRNQDHLAVTEALCILLGAKTFQSSLLNTQIDFMTRKDLTNINNFFNVDEINRIQSTVRKKWMPSIFFTFDTTNSDWDALNETVNIQVQKALNTSGKINVLKHPEVVKFLTKALTQESKKHIINQLKSYQNYLIKNRNIEKTNEIIKYIQTVINKVDKTDGFQDRSEIIDLINDMFTKKSWTKKVERNYNFETANNKINIILELLMEWYETTNIHDILTFNGNNQWKEQYANRYKENWTKYIQSIIFNTRPDEAYYQWRDTAWEEKTFQYEPGSFYPAYYEATEAQKYTDGSLREKTFSTVETYMPENMFLRNNWNLIYPEQVAFYLTNIGHNFLYKGGILEKGFITTATIDDIRYY